MPSSEDEIDAKAARILDSIRTDMLLEIKAALKTFRTGQTSVLLYWQNGETQTVKIASERTRKLSR
jgi:hypothetical protein